MLPPNSCLVTAFLLHPKSPGLKASTSTCTSSWSTMHFLKARLGTTITPKPKSRALPKTSGFRQCYLTLSRLCSSEAALSCQSCYTTSASLSFHVCETIFDLRCTLTRLARPLEVYILTMVHPLNSRKETQSRLVSTSNTPTAQ